MRRSSSDPDVASLDLGAALASPARAGIRFARLASETSDAPLSGALHLRPSVSPMPPSGEALGRETRQFPGLLAAARATAFGAPRDSVLHDQVEAAYKARFTQRGTQCSDEANVRRIRVLEQQNCELRQAYKALRAQMAQRLTELLTRCARFEEAHADLLHAHAGGLPAIKHPDVIPSAEEALHEKDAKIESLQRRIETEIERRTQVEEELDAARTRISDAEAENTRLGALLNQRTELLLEANAQLRDAAKSVLPAIAEALKKHRAELNRSTAPAKVRGPLQRRASEVLDRSTAAGAEDGR